MPATKSKAKSAAAPTPRSRTKFTLAFGAVYAEVGVAPLMSADAAPSGNYICEEHGCKVAQAWYCADGDHHLAGRDGIITAYPTDAGYVVVDKDALAAIGDKMVDLTAVVETASIDPLWYETTQLIWASDAPGAAQSYDLLVAMLRGTGKALVGRCVWTKSTRVVVIRWSDVTESLVLHVCQYEANVRWDNVRLVSDAVEEREPVDAALVKIAEQFAATLGTEFVPEGENDYAVALQSAIDAATAGQPVVVSAKADAPAPATDLMAALEASLKAAQDEKSAAKKSTAKGKVKA